MKKYQTIVFDCDGVILNSNKIKTQAFYEATKHLGDNYALSLVDYHVQYGGISRYAKFEYLITDILKKPVENSLLNDLLDRFASSVKSELIACEVTESLNEFRKLTDGAKWLVVSGGDQSELRDVFTARGLVQYFNGGIFGSPEDKDTILAREIERNNITEPALFIGDSKYDYQAASKAGLDFIFISQWTEVEDWLLFCKKNNVEYIESIKELCYEKG